MKPIPCSPSLSCTASGQGDRRHLHPHLEPPWNSGAGANRFRPGQFSMLWVFGVGELPISISGDPAERRPAGLHRALRWSGHSGLVSREVGDEVGVRGPFGAGWPVEKARAATSMIAGGIGLAPLRPVIYEVLNNRDKYGRLVILYGARSPHDVLYRKELTAWARQRDTQVLTTVDYGGSEAGAAMWAWSRRCSSRRGCSRRIRWPSPADPKS